MESGNSQGSGSSLDFGFGFNDEKFSDRIIHLQLIPNSKGHGDVHTSENPSSMDIFPTKTKTIHISTLILAARSRFFYKLFLNGMVESNPQVITLPIQESAEAAFMDLLKYMYTNTLSSATPSALVDVLCAADKYEVESCMNYCFQLLKELPMTCESALLYLDLPSTVLMVDTAAQSLTHAAKEFLIARFKDISKSKEEMLNLPLAGIKVVLSSDELQVDSEDDIYDFVMNWARRHYRKRCERRKMLTKHLLCLIRFPFMSWGALEEVLTCKDINLEQRSKLVFQALSLETGHRQLPPVKEQERMYKLRPVKVARFDSPHEECKVYLDLKYEECARLLPSVGIYSQNFYLAGEKFYLMVEHHVYEQTSVHSFAFYLGIEDDVSLESLDVDFEVSWRMKPNEEEFVGKCEFFCNFAEAGLQRGHNLFDVPWDTFIAENSPYFIDGVLHLRVVIKIVK